MKFVSKEVENLTLLPFWTVLSSQDLFLWHHVNQGILSMANVKPLRYYSTFVDKLMIAKCIQEQNLLSSLFLFWLFWQFLNLSLLISAVCQLMSICIMKNCPWPLGLCPWSVPKTSAESFLISDCWQITCTKLQITSSINNKVALNPQYKNFWNCKRLHHITLITIREIL